MSKWIAVLQSSYIPWKGYFDIINSADEFVIYDSVQFSRGDWRNRNRIKTAQGVQWLTIPVITSGRYGQKIDEVQISSTTWAKKHWQTIAQSYSAASCFEEYHRVFEDIYTILETDNLSEVNIAFIRAICSILGISTRLTLSTDYELIGDPTERLIHICQQTEATGYISGPAAKSYLKEELFEEEGIALQYMDYSEYPEYPQLFGEFEHTVSVLDLIFNTGGDAPHYMKSFS